MPPLGNGGGLIVPSPLKTSHDAVALGVSKKPKFDLIFPLVHIVAFEPDWQDIIIRDLDEGI